MKKLVCLVIIACLLAVCACFAFGACSEREGVIRLTEVTHSVFYAPLYVALEQGYFEAEGLQIELSNGGGADNCMTALISGQADIGLMGPEAAIYVANQGRSDYPIIFTQLTKKDGSFLMSRNAEPDFQWSDLVGKEIIGGRRGGVPAMTLEYALRINNLIDGENFTLNYDVKYDLIGAAFEGGTGDYCTMFEPAASNMEKAGKGYIVASVGEAAGDMPFTAFMATKSYMTEKQDTVVAFTRAIVKAMEYVNTHTAAEIAAALQASFDGTDLATLTSAIQSYMDIGAYSTSPVMLRKDFDHLQDVIIEAGVMDRRADFDALVDNSIAQSLLAQS